MKRCPQCQFIYPNSDEWCDFDHTPLESIGDELVEAAINTNSAKGSSQPIESRTVSRRFPKLIVIVAGALLLILVLSFATVYLIVKARSNRVAVSQVMPVQLPAIEKLPAPSPIVSTAIVEPTPEPTPKTVPTPTRTTVTKSAVSIGPVSTTGVSNNTKSGGKPVILLTTGGKIEADEVWRAKEGVWYRREGVVTLLKKERVRAIVGR